MNVLRALLTFAFVAGLSLPALAEANDTDLNNGGKTEKQAPDTRGDNGGQGDSPSDPGGPDGGRF